MRSSAPWSAGWLDTATSADLWLHRLLPDGSSDFSFGVGANAVVPFDLAGLAAANFDTATTLALDADQRLIAVGEGVRNAINRSSNVIAARFLPDGALDPAFGAGGKTVATFNPPAIISLDYGNTVGNVHVTPRGLLLTGSQRRPARRPRLPAPLHGHDAPHRRPGPGHQFRKQPAALSPALV